MCADHEKTEFRSTVGIWSLIGDTYSPPSTSSHSTWPRGHEAKHEA